MDMFIVIQNMECIFPFFYLENISIRYIENEVQRKSIKNFENKTTITWKYSMHIKQV